MQRNLRLLIALIWLANGLFCKVMDGVPRHREIITFILGDDYAGLLTIMIGCGEIFIALWILSGRFRLACGWFQIILVLVMNIIEQLLVPDLLLWGPWNFLWALGFSALVWWAFIRKETTKC